MAVCLYASFLVPVADSSSSSSSSKHVAKRFTQAPAIENGAATNKGDQPSVGPSKGGKVDKVVSSLPSAQISNQMTNTRHDATPATQGSNAACMISNSTADTTNRGGKRSKGGEVDEVVTSLPSAEISNQMTNTRHDATPATQGSNAACMISNSTADTTNRGGKRSKGGEVDEVVPSLPSAKVSGERPVEIQRRSGVQLTNPTPTPGLRAPPNFEDKTDINHESPMNEDEGVLDDSHVHNQENETYQKKLPPTCIRLASGKQGVDRDWERYRKAWRASLKRKFPHAKKAVPFKLSENDPNGEKNWGSFMSCFTE